MSKTYTKMAFSEGEFVPITPSGTSLPHLAGKTESEAWANLLKDAAHMPYKTVENFKKRGYTVEKWA